MESSFSYRFLILLSLFFPQSSLHAVVKKKIVNSQKKKKTIHKYLFQHTLHALGPKPLYHRTLNSTIND